MRLAFILHTMRKRDARSSVCACSFEIDWPVRSAKLRSLTSAPAGNGPTLRLALRDAEAEYARFSKAMYRDSDHLHNFRQEAKAMGVPKEWLD